LEDAGLGKKDVDGYFTVAANPGIGPLPIVDYLNLNPKYIDGTTIGGSSFVAHVNHAAAAIAEGRCRVALITYGSTSRSSGVAVGTRERIAGVYLDQFEALYGTSTVGLYAMVARRHMHEYGTTSEQLAEIAVATRTHASLNPLALYRDPISVKDVLASPMISAPLHLLDCRVSTDGGGARAAPSSPAAASRSAANCRSTPTAAGCRPTIRGCAGSSWSSRPSSNCAASAASGR